jgi:hypothetical protein
MKLLVMQFSPTISLHFISLQTKYSPRHKHILISPTSFMGTPNSIRILYNTSLLTWTIGFLEVYKKLMCCLAVISCNCSSTYYNNNFVTVLNSAVIKCRWIITRNKCH